MPHSYSDLSRDTTASFLQLLFLPMKTPFALASLIFALLSPTFSIAAEPPPTDVVVVEHGKVENAFAVGQPILVNSSFKVQAGRRVMAGNVEVHEHDTDIFYVQEGTATFVTGGAASELKSTAPGEARGTAITGGITRHLAKGDVIVIPAGIPHQFTEVSGTFLYFVVKVTR